MLSYEEPFGLVEIVGYEANEAGSPMALDKGEFIKKDTYFIAGSEVSVRHMFLEWVFQFAGRMRIFFPVPVVTAH